MAAHKLTSLGYRILFELDLLPFFVSLLATAFVNLVLKQYQTIRPFYPSDATLWVCTFAFPPRFPVQDKNSGERVLFAHSHLLRARLYLNI